MGMGARALQVGDARAVVADREAQALGNALEDELQVLRPRMVHHVVEALLRDAEERDLEVGGEALELADLHLAGEPRRDARLVHVPSHRRREPEVVEQRRAQVLDDAALEVDALVDHSRQARHAVAELGILSLVRDQPREVHLGRREDAAQLVVQLAGEALLLALRVGLQEGREGRQLARARGDVLEDPLLLGEERAQLLPPAAQFLERGAVLRGGERLVDLRCPRMDLGVEPGEPIGHCGLVRTLEVKERGMRAGCRYYPRRSPHRHSRGAKMRRVPFRFVPRGYTERRNTPMRSDTTKAMRKMKNRIFAMPAAPAAMPPKPRTAAIRAMMKKTAAQ